MNQQELEQWIAQQGGQGKVQYSRSTREVDNPAADPLTAKAAGVTFQPMAPAKITVSEEKWTAVDAEGKPTGAVLHVRRKPDGDFDIVDQANPNPTKPNDDTPEKRNAAILQAQRERNAALPPDQDPAYETDEDRRKRGLARIAQQGSDAQAAETRARQQQADERQRKIDEQNAATAAAASRRADSAEARAIAEANRVGSKVESIPINGQHYTRITKTSADGTKTEIENYGPDGTRIAALPTDTKPGQMVTVDGEQWWAAPNADPSQPPTLTRIQPGGNVQPKDDGPQFAPGMTPSEFLQLRRAYWLEQRKAGVPQKSINDGWDRDVQVANARQNERSTEATQQNQRLSSAMTGFGQAQSAVDSINKYLPEGSDLGGQAFEAMLGIQRGQAQRMGGYGPMGNAAPLAVPPAPIGPDPSAQVAAIPPAPAPTGNVAAPAAPGVPTLASPEGQGMLATNEANRQLYEATHGAGAPPGAAPAGPSPTATAPPAVPSPTPTAPPAVQGEPSPLGDTGAPPVSMAPQGAPVAAIPESPYDFQARVVSTPPWKLTEQDYQQAQAMGLGDQFWQTGRVA